jgi:hypothetical protein
MLFVLAACPPQMGPSATGQLDISGPTAGFSTLVVRMTSKTDGNVSQSEELAIPATWPMEFEIGSGLEPKSGDYQIDAWLAATTGTSAPEAGAPHASIDVHATCHGDSCDPIENLTLTLAP